MSETTPRPTKTLVFLTLFGILLPLLTLAYELRTGAARDTFFDPIPTHLHALLIGLVPLTNTVLALTLGRERKLARPWLHLHGLALSVTILYTLVFLPITPLAVLGLMFYGVGILALSPLLAMVATLVVRARLKRQASLPRLWPALLLALACVILFDTPAMLTRIGLQMATSDEPATQLDGMRWLRRIGSEELLLRHCYARRGSADGLLGMSLDLQRQIPPEEARTVFYRVTGKSFNSLPAPEVRGAREWGDLFSDRGGDAVGGKAAALHLASSSMDGSLDARAALGYLEWTMVVQNRGHQLEEVRATLRLPPGAVVSRLTLWINGEEREAAFGARSQVRGAYEKVVKASRDPVLVTTAGHDRVLMQMFPVPAQGDMKVRIGITTPLVMRSLDKAHLLLPSFAEHNFTIAPSFRHAIWVESNDTTVVRGRLAEPGPLQGAASVAVARDPAARSAWGNDPHDKGAVLQTIGPRPAAAPRRIALVIDGSASLAAVQGQLAQALGALPPTSEVALVFAGDDAPAIFMHNPADALATMRFLRGLDFAGGQDNIAALAQGWDWVAQRPEGALVWIHGPQAVKADSEALLQRYRRRPGLVRFYQFEAVGGANLVAPAFEGIIPVIGVARLGSMGDDLRQLLQGWQAPGIEIKRARTEAHTYATKTSGHLARLWAADEVHSLMLTDRDAATALAQRYQLVTPVTGAVVLETREQFDEAGLTPVPPGTVPTVPEPETWAMLLVALLLLALRYRQRRWYPA